MKKVYHLANCTTCQRILKELKPGAEFVLQDIKSEPITEQQLDTMQKLAGSYEALFSRIAMKYRSLGLNQIKLTEKDYKKYILEEQRKIIKSTFLKNIHFLNDRLSF